jgi:CRP/FNR family transcriptional regulator, anaerobic regulatory protein
MCPADKEDFMNARPKPVSAVVSERLLGCAICLAHISNFCEAGTGWRPQGEAGELQNTAHAVAARRIVFREHDLHDAVPVICQGWAASMVMLSDGSRQILSFLLPGDIVSTALLFDARAHCLVEAITEVRYRSFKRADLKKSLRENPELLEQFSKAWSDEKARADQLIVDLGRRSGEERIARLIHGLHERLAKRNMVQPDTMEMEFPLRQHHIADATGLTPVHVSKVLSEFRRARVIKISERSLTILDPVRFRRIAHMR